MLKENSKVVVSVIMPAYNAEKYIEKAIYSVLMQEVPFELLVIDDCSTDKTAEIVNKFIQSGEKCVKLIRNKTNTGVAESRNKGIQIAVGDYIAFLDADDWWEENKLKVQLEFLKKQNGVICCTARELMTSNGSSLGRIIEVPLCITYQMLLRTNSIPCSSVLIKTEVAREFYMKHDELHEDYILWLQVLKKYGYAYGYNEPMLKSRMSEGGKSRNKIKSAKMQYGVYRYMGIGRMKALIYLVEYILNGMKKYYI